MSNNRKHYIYYVSLILSDGKRHQHKTTAVSQARAIVRAIDALERTDIVSTHCTEGIPKVKHERQKALNYKNAQKERRKKEKEKQIWIT